MYSIEKLNKGQYEGKIFSTKNYGELIVVSYISNTEVLVRFTNTGYETTCELGNLLKGKVKDRMAANVFGVGVTGETCVSVGGKLERDYTIWYGVLRRCYSKHTSLKFGSYKGCTVSEEFLYFPEFKAWCGKQVGHDQDGWHLDKDILVKSNKVYSPETCCFIPSEINTLLVKRNSLRGEFPIGVGFYKPLNKYVSRLSTYGKARTLGYFSSVEEAFYAYKEAKETHIKEVANKWKDQIDSRVYEALIGYQVEITD